MKARYFKNVRAHPDIRIEENYDYSSVIRESRFTEFSKGHGIIKFDLNYGAESGFDWLAYYDMMPYPSLEPPFHGRRFLVPEKESQAVMRFLHKKLRSTTKPLHINHAKVGHLGIDRYGNKITRQSLIEKLSPSNNLYPIELPVDHIENRIKDNVSVHRKIPYEVGEPVNMPLSISVIFTDEVTNLGKRDSIIDYLLENNEETKERRKSVFSDNVILIFDIDIMLPKQIANKMAALGTNPGLDYFYLEWPYGARGVIVGKENKIIIKDKMRTDIVWDENEEYNSYLYNPEKKRLEWKDLIFNRKDSTERITEYTVSLYCVITEPVLLLNIDELIGKLRITLPGGLLSGADFKYFGATGHPITETKKLTFFTKINSNVSVDLTAVFRQKNYYPYRKLEFEGVIPSMSRFEDIVSILNDFGIKTHTNVTKKRVKKVKYPGFDERDYYENNENFSQGTIFGKKNIDANPAYFQLRLKGKNERMHKKQILQGGYEASMEVEVGKITIEMIATHTDSTELTNLLNSIQDSIKERFMQISIAGSY